MKSWPSVTSQRSNPFAVLDVDPVANAVDGELLSSADDCAGKSVVAPAQKVKCSKKLCV